MRYIIAKGIRLSVSNHRSITEECPEYTVKYALQIILMRDVQGIGKQGELAKVVNGYWCAPSNITKHV